MADTDVNQQYGTNPNAASNPSDTQAPQTQGTPASMGTQDKSGMSTGSGSAAAPQSTTAGVGTPVGVGDVNSHQFDGTKAAQGVAGGYGAQHAGTTDWNVDQNQTVQGQVKGIIDKNSPLMQQAVAQANQSANSRGLLNSSMAVTAGQSALYSAAMPMATQDAQTNAQAAAANAAAHNRTSEFNAGADNTAGQFTAEQKNAMSSQNASMSNDMTKAVMGNTLQAQLANQNVHFQQSAQAYDAAVKGAMQGADDATKTQLANLDSSVRTTLMQMQSQYNVQMQTSNSMSSTYQSMISGISQIMGNKDLNAEAKQAAINNMMSMYNDSMQVQSQISGLNLGSILSPQSMGVSGGQQGYGGGIQGLAQRFADQQPGQQPVIGNPGNYGPGGYEGS
jgi:hypothetical protein